MGGAIMRKTGIPKKWFWKSMDSALTSARAVEERILALGLSQNLSLEFKDALRIAPYLQKASEIYSKSKYKI